MEESIFAIFTYWNIAMNQGALWWRYTIQLYGSIVIYFLLKIILWVLHYRNDEGLFTWWRYTSRNWPKYSHPICNYMQLLVICNYIWTFLQLFLVLAIFVTIVQLVCDYFGAHPCMWTTFSLVFIQEQQFMSH